MMAHAREPASTDAPEEHSAPVHDVDTSRLRALPRGVAPCAVVALCAVLLAAISGRTFAPAAGPAIPLGAATLDSSASRRLTSDNSGGQVLTTLVLVGGTGNLVGASAVLCVPCLALF